MIKFTLYLLVFFLIPKVGNTQILLNQEGEAFTGIPFFNSDVIFYKHIKTIEGKYSTKNEGEIIRESADWFRYRFDEKGRLTESIDIRTVNKKKDTTLHQYKYDSLNQLIEHRRSENKGYTTVKKTYDSLHRLESETTFREIFSYSKNKVLKSDTMNSEYFNYVIGSLEREQIRCNNRKLPYQIEQFFYNTVGYLTEKKTLLLMSSSEYTTKYTYNENGLLTSKARYNEKDILADEEWEYRYDPLGNVIEIHYFRFGQLQKDLQIVYDTKTQLLGSTIERDVNTNALLLLRFTKYTYYE
jgi:YD repeat-containing protein